jgi:hypothetical protein
MDETKSPSLKPRKCKKKVNYRVVYCLKLSSVLTDEKEK